MLYIGPGAGFAFLGSFLTLFLGLLASAGSILIWPFRMAWLALRKNRNAMVKRVIFLGLDGLDPRLTEKYMAEGKMPNLARLREQGSYRRLRTTFPAISPVAWSTFATGVNPARHNIFDFLSRDVRTYAPEIFLFQGESGLCRNAAQERTFLEDPGTPRGKQHYSARTDYISTGRLRRMHAFRYGHSRFTRYSGNLLLVHQQR